MASYNIQQIKQTARGRWLEILSAHGVTLSDNPRRHNPCPGCGGRNRFRMDDRNGDGTFICSQGGGELLSGDGFDLLQHVLGWTFKEALTRVAEYLGIAPETHQGPIRPRYEGADYRTIQAVRYSVLILDMIEGDCRAGRPLPPDATQAASEAQFIIKQFEAQGGRIDV